MLWALDSGFWMALDGQVANVQPGQEDAASSKRQKASSLWRQ
jgi:hypothetical protein